MTRWKIQILYIIATPCYVPCQNNCLFLTHSHLLHTVINVVPVNAHAELKTVFVRRCKSVLLVLALVIHFFLSAVNQVKSFKDLIDLITLFLCGLFLFFDYKTELNLNANQLKSSLNDSFFTTQKEIRHSLHKFSVKTFVCLSVCLSVYLSVSLAFSFSFYDTFLFKCLHFLKSKYSLSPLLCMMKFKNCRYHIYIYLCFLTQRIFL